MLQECPVCQWKPIKGEECPQCKTALGPLFRVAALPQVYYEEGVLLLEAGRLEEAIPNLIVAAQQEHPQRAAASAALGRAYAKKGWRTEALAQLDRAIELDSTNEEARKAKAAVESEIQSQKSAEKEGRIAIAWWRQLAFVAPIVFLLGVAAFPLGQRIFSSPQKGPILSAEVARSIEKELSTNAAKTAYVVVSPGPQGKIHVAGRVPAASREAILRAARETSGTAQLETAELKAIAAPQPERMIYTVRAGDSLWRIARRVYGRSADWKLLYEQNRDRLKNPRRLTIGQELMLPPNPERD